MQKLRELVYESEWSRTYRTGSNSTFYESKFVVDGLKITVNELSRRWPGMKAEERSDFALAFGAKTTPEGDDESVLSFLMSAGDEPIWRMIALKLTKHRDRDAVVRFLGERIKESEDSKGNYYQAAEELADVRLLGVLEEDFDRLSSSIQSISPQSYLDAARARDYLQLCRTLATITGHDQYLAIVRSALGHSSELVRRKAQLLLGIEGEAGV